MSLVRRKMKDVVASVESMAGFKKEVGMLDKLRRGQVVSVHSPTSLHLVAATSFSLNPP